MTRSLLFALIGYVCLPATSLAETQPAVLKLMTYMDEIGSCLQASATPDAAHTCIGSGSAICMETEADGYTTVGMMFCIMAETESWDRLLNLEYGKAMERLRVLDGTDSPQYAVRAERLRDAQRAWIPFRDAECALAYSEFGAGTMRQLSGNGCLLDMTARRTIDLKFLMSVH